MGKLSCSNIVMIQGRVSTLHLEHNASCYGPGSVILMILPGGDKSSDQFSLFAENLNDISSCLHNKKNYTTTYKEDTLSFLIQPENKSLVVVFNDLTAFLYENEMNFITNWFRYRYQEIEDRTI